ncbi:hypothetical protein [Bordetella genomosp. 5]|uniref:Uncharacterized protein n=1 Tax=Bordetella genomosp. 5 TaxID=1395608 RepID=A0A261T8S0_9BORD|nr:hypothetical protein [Bordetella genomosp. 5]OZI45701.1 hypothetical protein CAL25_20920 [Bordetella genomosp. 5]
MSKIIESLRADMRELYAAGAIDEVTTRNFDALSPPPVRERPAEQISSRTTAASPNGATD